MSAVRTVYIELRASAEKLRADMALANSSIITIGKSGEESGKRVSRGMEDASGSIRRIGARATEAALALEGAYRLLTGAAMRYGAATATAGGSTEGLINTYRALRIALSPTPFTIASIAAGVLTEETIRLVQARAKLIEQQSLISATGGLSFAVVQRFDAVSAISGGDSEKLRGLSSSLTSRMSTDRGSVSSGLEALGLSPEDPDLLRKIAVGFSSIEDPVRRAAAAVSIFGAANAGEALRQLNAAFAESSSAVQRYGLVMDTLSAKQIYQLNHELESLKTPFRMLKEELSASAESAKNNLEIIAGALDDMSNRGMRSLDGLLMKIPGLQVLAGMAQDLKSLSPGELSRRPGTAGVANGTVADDLFAQSQAAHYRQSQTLEGQQAARADAQSRADSAYAALSADAAKRQANPHDPNLLSGDQRLILAAQQQSAQASANAIGDTVKKLEAAKEAAEQAALAAKELADFQAKSGERLNALFQSFTAGGIKDPAARTMYEGRVDVLRDADKTTPEEKAGRAEIATQRFRQVLAEEQAKWAQGVMDEIARANSFARDAFSKKLGQDTADNKKAAEDQVKEDAAATAGLRDGAEQSSRLATIRSAPGDEVDLAAQILAIRLKTVAAERAIVDAHRESYTVEQGDVESARLDREAADANLAYQERLAEIQRQRAQEAINAGAAYQQRLRQLSQDVEALNSIKVTEGNVLDIELARKTLNDQILDSVVKQKLALGSLMDGWDAFWLEMQEQAAKPGQILYEGMNSALEKTSGDLTKLVTGQQKKTSWGKDLESTGRSMAQSSIKAIIQRGLGELGKKFGIKPPAAKPDGTAAHPYHAVIDGDKSASGDSKDDTSSGAGGARGVFLGLLDKIFGHGQAPAATSGAGKPDGTQGNPFYVIEESQRGSSGGSLGGLGVLGGGYLGGIFGAVEGGGAGAAESITSSISYMSSGGDADPGRVYGVAEAGEAELVSPKNSSRITPISKLGGNFTYHIDARNADLGAENRVARAVEAAHNSAVSKGVQASAERAKRTPQRSR